MDWNSPLIQFQLSWLSRAIKNKKQQKVISVTNKQISLNAHGGGQIYLVRSCHFYVPAFRGNSALQVFLCLYVSRIYCISDMSAIWCLIYILDFTFKRCGPGISKHIAEGPYISNISYFQILIKKIFHFSPSYRAS